MSASANTTTGALPPSSKWARFSCCAAETATEMPARIDPVIDTSPGIGCSTSILPVCPSPLMTLNTPGGRISPASSASLTVDSGVVSLGLRTTALPAAMAGAIFQIAIISG